MSAPRDDVPSCANGSARKLNRAPAGPALIYDRLMGIADERLMRYLQDGHADALAVLFDRYHRLVMNVALRILRDVGEAEELMQSVFLEILRSADQFDSQKGTAKIWILQYAYHRSFNRRQYLSLRGFYVNEPEKMPVRTGTHGRHTLDALESAGTVQQALRQLNKMQRETLKLAFYDGLTMHEIADKTGETFDSVRHHYYRGLEKLRSLLCKTGPKRDRNSVQGVAHVRPQ